MTEKYFLLNDEIYIYSPDTHEVFRVDPNRMERLEHPKEMMVLRLRAMEVTRQQAEHMAPSLEFLRCHSL